MRGDLSPELEEEVEEEDDVEDEEDDDDGGFGFTADHLAALEDEA